VTADPRLFDATRGHFARVEGVDDGPSEWHVNKHIVVTAASPAETGMVSRFDNGDVPPDATRHGFVLQRADASHEWLVLVVDEVSDGGAVETAALADGERGEPEPVGSDVRVVAVADSREALQADE